MPGGKHDQARQEARQRAEPERRAVPFTASGQHAGNPQPGDDGADRPHGMHNGAGQFGHPANREPGSR